MIREAHENGSVLGQPDIVVTTETMPDQCPLQILCISWPDIELQGQLKLSRTKINQSLERSKQRWGPWTNVRLSSDQILVVTSIDVGPIAITFTEDGRPPRERLDTVPAVEITVPFLVCSI
jgi:hypothetical protein